MRSVRAWPRNKQESYKSFHSTLVGLARATDALLGKGSVIDSAFGVARKIKTPKLKNGLDGLAESLDWFGEVINEELKKSRASAELYDLRETAKALSVIVRIHNRGPGANYLRQLSQIYSYKIAPINKRVLLTARKKLEYELAALGFSERWPRSLHSWHKAGAVDMKEYMVALKSYSKCFKRITFDKILSPMIGTKAAEAIEANTHVSVTRAHAGVTWSAYHYYCGNFRSRIEIAPSANFNKYEAAIFAAHEIYPGHHTQAILLDFLLKGGRIGSLYGLTLLNTPASLIAEGLADFGFTLLDIPEPNMRIAYLADRLFTDVRHNIAIALITGSISFEAASEMLCSEAGCNLKRARKALKFTQEWRYYFPIYAEGLRLVEHLYIRHGRHILKPLFLSYSLAGCEQRCAKED